LDHEVGAGCRRGLRNRRAPISIRLDAHEYLQAFLARLLDQPLDPVLGSLDQPRLRGSVRRVLGIHRAVELELCAVTPREPLPLLQRGLDEAPWIDHDEDLLYLQ